MHRAHCTQMMMILIMMMIASYTNVDDHRHHDHRHHDHDETHCILRYPPPTAQSRSHRLTLFHCHPPPHLLLSPVIIACQ